LEDCYLVEWAEGDVTHFEWKKVHEVCVHSPLLHRTFQENLSRVEREEVEFGLVSDKGQVTAVPEEVLACEWRDDWMHLPAQLGFLVKWEELSAAHTSWVPLLLSHKLMEPHAKERGIDVDMKLPLSAAIQKIWPSKNHWTCVLSHKWCEFEDVDPQVPPQIGLHLHAPSANKWVPLSRAKSMHHRKFSVVVEEYERQHKKEIKTLEEHHIPVSQATFGPIPDRFLAKGYDVHAADTHPGDIEGRRGYRTSLGMGRGIIHAMHRKYPHAMEKRWYYLVEFDPAEGCWWEPVSTFEGTHNPQLAAMHDYFQHEHKLSQHENEYPGPERVVTRVITFDPDDMIIDSTGEVGPCVLVKRAGLSNAHTAWVMIKSNMHQPVIKKYVEDHLQEIQEQCPSFQLPGPAVLAAPFQVDPVLSLPPFCAEKAILYYDVPKHKFLVEYHGRPVLSWEERRSFSERSTYTRILTDRYIAAFIDAYKHPGKRQGARVKRVLLHGWHEPQVENKGPFLGLLVQWEGLHLGYTSWEPLEDSQDLDALAAQSTPLAWYVGAHKRDLKVLREQRRRRDQCREKYRIDEYQKEMEQIDQMRNPQPNDLPEIDISGLYAAFEEYRLVFKSKSASAPSVCPVQQPEAEVQAQANSEHPPSTSTDQQQQQGQQASGASSETEEKKDQQQQVGTGTETEQQVSTSTPLPRARKSSRRPAPLPLPLSEDEDEDIEMTPVGESTNNLPAAGQSADNPILLSQEEASPLHDAGETAGHEQQQGAEQSCSATTHATEQSQKQTTGWAPMEYDPVEYAKAQREQQAKRSSHRQMRKTGPQTHQPVSQFSMGGGSSAPYGPAYPSYSTSSYAAPSMAPSHTSSYAAPPSMAPNTGRSFAPPVFPVSSAPQCVPPHSIVGGIPAAYVHVPGLPSNSHPPVHNRTYPAPPPAMYRFGAPPPPPPSTSSSSSLHPGGSVYSANPVHSASGLLHGHTGAPPARQGGHTSGPSMEDTAYWTGEAGHAPRRRTF
jgi:hypothetical protein